MPEDRDSEEFKKTMKRLQEDYQLEIELENEMAETAKSEENSEKEEGEQRN
jgi:RNase H-fold protein (predicted Holliday junction resolvase)